jgi:hypothetical protein
MCASFLVTVLWRGLRQGCIPCACGHRLGNEKAVPLPGVFSFRKENVVCVCVCVWSPPRVASGSRSLFWSLPMTSPRCPIHSFTPVLQMQQEYVKMQPESAVQGSPVYAQPQPAYAQGPQPAYAQGPQPVYVQGPQPAYVQGGGMCPHAQVSSSVTGCGIATAIIFFPLGLLCCLLMPQVRCMRCGALLESGC